MTLRFHNTLARAKAEFAPLDAANVRMYVCGPTVYDVAHIGNARPVIVFDVLYRLLRHVYGAGNVTYVRNITDVDDKIIAASEATGEAIGDITDLRGYLGAFQAQTVDTNITSLGVAFENLSASESTIRDLDFAQETAAFTRSQILFQSGIAVLAQSNLISQSVLTLLG